MKRKPQNQPALKSLSDADKEVLADWLRKENYLDVLPRVNKPRSEGGFGLNISKKPLQTFYARVALLDLINSRVSDDKKMSVAQFESLAAGEILLSSSSRLTPGGDSENDPHPSPDPGTGPSSSPHLPPASPVSHLEGISAEVHEAVMHTALDLATSGDNTPTSLLALQRLADFPARAEYREHKRQMDEHRKQIAEERLKLANRAQEFRERQAEFKNSSRQNRSSSTISASSSSNPFHELEGLEVHELMREIEPKPIPGTADSPDGNTSNVDATASNVYATGSNVGGTPSNPHHSTASNPEPALAGPSAPLPISAELPPYPLAAPAPTSTSLPATPEKKSSPACPAAQPAPFASPVNASAASAPAAPSGPTANVTSSLLTNAPAAPSLSAAPKSLEERVNEYTLARHFEAADGRNAAIVGRAAARNFKSKMQWCPCGQQLPCPDHGDFPKFFWEIAPDSSDYAAILKARSLPFTAPLALIREQEKRARREAAQKLKPLDLQAAVQDPNSALVHHARKRWRAYIPRPPCTPPPDDSWISECPCGTPLPCIHHDDLFREVRYIKPWDPDYPAALTRAGIPVYTPSKEELIFNPASGTSAAVAPSELRTPVQNPTPVPADPQPVASPAPEPPPIHAADNQQS